MYGKTTMIKSDEKVKVTISSGSDPEDTPQASMKRITNKDESQSFKENLIEEITNNEDFAWEIIDEANEGISEENEWILNDKEIIMALIQHSGFALKKASDSLKKDKDLVTMAVNKDGAVLEFVDDSFKKDKDIVMKAISNDGGAIRYADDSLKKDREFVIQAIKSFLPIASGNALEFVDQSFQKDKTIVRLATEVCGFSFKYADESLKKDRSMVMMAVKEDGENLQYAAASFKKDKEIVIAALNNRVDVLKYADQSLKDDPDIIKLLKSGIVTKHNIHRHPIFGGFNTYTGQVKNDKPHGRGKMRNNQGSSYNGCFKDGKFSGKGVLKQLGYTDFEYVGNFENNEYSGYGVLKEGKERVSQGEWKKGSMHGKGSVISDTSKRIGDFKFGMMHGMQRLETDRGSGKEIFIQEFENDEIIFNKDSSEEIDYYILSQKTFDNLFLREDLNQISRINLEAGFIPFAITSFQKLNNSLNKFDDLTIVFNFTSLDDLPSTEYQKTIFEFYNPKNFQNHCLPNICFLEISTDLAFGNPLREKSKNQYDSEIYINRFRQQENLKRIWTLNMDKNPISIFSSQKITDPKKMIPINVFLINLITSIYRAIILSNEEFISYKEFAIYMNNGQVNKVIFNFINNKIFESVDLSSMKKLSLEQHIKFCNMKLKDLNCEEYIGSSTSCDIFTSIQMKE